MTDISLVEPDVQLDITGFVCPMTFVRTRLALDRLGSQQVIAITMKGEEPKTNVPRSITELGHEILAMDEQPDGTAILLVRKR